MRNPSFKEKNVACYVARYQVDSELESNGVHCFYVFKELNFESSIEESKPC